MERCDLHCDHYWDLEFRGPDLQEVEARCQDCGHTRIYTLATSPTPEHKDCGPLCPTHGDPRDTSLRRLP